MKKSAQLLNRWKTEYDFRTFVTAAASLAVTALFALYNGFLGVRHASLWNGAICVYYLILVLLRGTILLAAGRLSRRGQRKAVRGRVCLAASAWLLILNLSLVVPLSMMVRQLKPVRLTLIPAIAMAAYTTYKVTMAAIYLRRRKRSSDSLVRLLRTIGFVDALVSILTLQNTLIMVQSAGEDSSMLILTALTSGAVWLVILFLSAASLRSAIRQLRQ